MSANRDHSTSKKLPQRNTGSRDRERQPRSAKQSRQNDTNNTRTWRRLPPVDPGVNNTRNRAHTVDCERATLNPSDYPELNRPNRANSIDSADDLQFRPRPDVNNSRGSSNSLSPRIRHTNAYQSTGHRQSLSPSPRPTLSNSGNSSSSHSYSSPRATKFSLSNSGSSYSSRSSISPSPGSRTSRSPRPIQSDSGDNLHSRSYIKCQPLRGVLGYIANTHDSLNFDIDIEFPEGTESTYSSVITHQYACTALGENITYPSLESTQARVAYRCRLFGVGINYESSQRYSQANSKLMIDIKQLIDACEGWVILDLNDIDVYGRLLVDVRVPILPDYTQCVDLKTYILEADRKLTDPVYREYQSGEHGGWWDVRWE